MAARHRLAIVCSHGIQYLAPWFRHAAAHPRLAVTVFYGDAHGLDDTQAHDPEFGRSVRWDVELLSGYRSVLLKNHAPRPGVGRFWGIASLEVFDKLRRTDFDAVLIQGWNYALYPLALLAARVRGLPVLVRGESVLLPDDAQSLAAASLSRKAKRQIVATYLQQCAAALAVSTGNRRLLQSYGVPDSRIFFSPYAVDGAHFRLNTNDREAARSALRTQLGLAEDAPLFLFVGKLIPVKAPALLLQALADVLAREPRATLAIVGDGALLQQLEADAQKLPPGRVHFLGFRNQSALPAIYAAADALILPSRSETFGVVVLEAMHAGLPVVVSDRVGCAEDLVSDGVTGFRFPSGNAAALAELPRLLKGYGETQARGLRNYNSIFESSVAPAVATPELQGGTGWRSENRFELRIQAADGPGGSGVQRVAWEVCHLDGTNCVSSSGAPLGAIPVNVPGPGEWKARFWAFDALRSGAKSGWSETLRYDPVVPGRASIAAPSGWVSGKSAGAVIDLPTFESRGPSGIAGYAVTTGPSEP